MLRLRDVWWSLTVEGFKGLRLCISGLLGGSGDLVTGYFRDL